MTDSKHHEICKLGEHCSCYLAGRAEGEEEIFDCDEHPDCDEIECSYCANDRQNHFRGSIIQLESQLKDANQKIKELEEELRGSNESKM